MVRRRSDRASTKSSTASRNPTGNASVLVSAYPRLSRTSSRGRRRGGEKPGGPCGWAARQVKPNPNADARVARRICLDLLRFARPLFAASPGLRKDEDDWHKLEQFRRALLRIVEGEDWLLVDGEEASAIALAVESCANDTFVDEVGRGCRMRIPEGARLQLDGVFDTKEDVAAAVSAMGNGDNWLCFLRCMFSLPAGCARGVCRGA